MFGTSPAQHIKHYTLFSSQQKIIEAVLIFTWTDVQII
jgi:hypothetical protein